MTSTNPPIGLVLGSHIAPEGIAPMAQLAESLGYSELWFAEDYFFTGGVAGATAALAATQRIPVGLGIVSSMVRHPALLAMELATMARMHPGRLWPGIGLGVPHWVGQMGLMPKSPLTAMRECGSALRVLLDGQELTREGRLFSFHDVKLTHAPEERLPVYFGVLGPKMLSLAGEVADGTVTSVLAGTAYIRWARERIAEGAATAGRSDHHRVAAFAMCAIDDDRARARDALRGVMAFYLAAVPKSSLSDVYGISDQIAEILAGAGDDPVGTMAREMPEQWLDDLVVAGDADEVAVKLRALLDAGADSVEVFPFPTDQAEDAIRTIARDVFPRL